MLSLATLFYPLALRQVAVLWTMSPGKKSSLPDMRTPLPKPTGGVAQQQDSCVAGPQPKLLPCQKQSSGDHSVGGKSLVLKNSWGANKPFHLQNPDASSASIFSPSKSETVSPSFLSFSRKSFSSCPLLQAPFACACLTPLAVFQGDVSGPKSAVKHSQKWNCCMNCATSGAHVGDTLPTTPPSLLPQPTGLAVSCCPVPGSFYPSSLQLPKGKRECSCEEMPPHPALGRGQTSREEEPTWTNVFYHE